VDSLNSSEVQRSWGNGGVPFTATFGLCLCQPRAGGKEGNAGGLQRCDRMQTPYLTGFEKQSHTANARAGSPQEVQ